MIRVCRRVVQCYLLLIVVLGDEAVSGYYMLSPEPPRGFPGLFSAGIGSGSYGAEGGMEGPAGGAEGPDPVILGVEPLAKLNIGKIGGWLGPGLAGGFDCGSRGRSDLPIRAMGRLLGEPGGLGSLPRRGGEGAPKG